ncbi:MAG: SLBB domain-containing protein, partial [Planctomycetes bacterium]|nr:SLBB domain-containing protein [Planctomycetota bacterium]
MFNHRFTTCVVPALSLLLFVPSADGQQSGRPITPSTRQSSPSRHYFTVIGAVRVPGVYEYSSGLPTLADVIHAADGLTSEASGTIRIVREGKVSRQMFYSPDSEMRLLSGDILILDKSLSGTQGGGRSSTGYESQSLVQIVAVNLIHRPVVLSLPSELATLERLVTDLNQSPNIIPTVKILQAKTSGHVGSSGNSATFRLISESVLIFNPAVVRIDQIPKLPPVYRPKVRTASYRQILAPSSKNSPYGNSKSAIELAAGSSSQGQSVPIDHSEKMLRVPPPLENASLQKAKPASESPKFWTPVNKGTLSTK